jgi:hypothetical protein
MNIINLAHQKVHKLFSLDISEEEQPGVKQIDHAAQKAKKLMEISGHCHKVDEAVSLRLYGTTRIHWALLIGKYSGSEALKNFAAEVLQKLATISNRDLFVPIIGFQCISFLAVCVSN